MEMMAHNNSIPRSGNFSLECLVLGDSQDVEITWYKGEDEDETEIGLGEVLDVEGVIQDDEGIYTCVAIRKDQQNSATTEIFVYSQFT